MDQKYEQDDIYIIDAPDLEFVKRVAELTGSGPCTYVRFNDGTVFCSKHGAFKEARIS